MNDDIKELVDDILKGRFTKRVQRRGKKWVVTDASGKKVLGTHNSREDAMRQLRAVETNKKQKGVNISLNPIEMASKKNTEGSYQKDPTPRDEEMRLARNILKGVNIRVEPVEMPSKKNTEDKFSSTPKPRGEEERIKVAKALIDKLFDKAKVPLKPGQEPPKGAKVITGPRGGKYYESDGGEKKKPKDEKNRTEQNNYFSPELKKLRDLTKDYKTAEDFVHKVNLWAYYDPNSLDSKINPLIKTKKRIPITTKGEYSGQLMSWTEERVDTEVLEEPLVAYHYSDNNIDSFIPKETCFFYKPYNNLETHRTIYNKYPKVYAVEIPKGTEIDTYGDELRAELTENMKMYEVEHTIPNLVDFYNKIKKTNDKKEEEKAQDAFTPFSETNAPNYEDEDEKKKKTTKKTVCEQFQDIWNRIDGVDTDKVITMAKEFRPGFDLCLMPTTKEEIGRKARFVMKGEVEILSHPILKTDGTESGDLVIGGYASTDSIDADGEIIDQDALRKAFIEYMRDEHFANINLMHGSFQAGVPLMEVEINDKVHKTQFDENGLYLISKIRNDNTEECQRVRKQIMNGELRGYSIGGEALDTRPVCEPGSGCFDKITKLDLWEITLCQKGKNPDSQFDVLKAPAA